MYLLLVIFLCAVYALLDRNINMLIAVGVGFLFWLMDFFAGNFQVKPFGSRGKAAEPPSVTARPRSAAPGGSVVRPTRRPPVPAPEVDKVEAPGNSPETQG